MRRLILSVALGLALAGVAQGQGTFLFTWHGNSNFFNASFLVTDAEMQPGAGFSSPEFTNSLNLSSLSGHSYSIKDDSTLITGGVNPWSFGFTFVDFNTGLELLVRAGEPPRGAMAGAIFEQPMSGPQLYAEGGFWTYTAIPEPSVVSLAVAGAACFAFRRGRARSSQPLHCSRIMGEAPPDSYYYKLLQATALELFLPG